MGTAFRKSKFRSDCNIFRGGEMAASSPPRVLKRTTEETPCIAKNQFWETIQSRLFSLAPRWLSVSADRPSDRDPQGLRPAGLPFGEHISKKDNSEPQKKDDSRPSTETISRKKETDNDKGMCQRKSSTHKWMAAISKGYK